MSLVCKSHYYDVRQMVIFYFQRSFYSDIILR